MPKVVCMSAMDTLYSRQQFTAHMRLMCQPFFVDDCMYEFSKYYVLQIQHELCASTLQLLHTGIKISLAAILLTLSAAGRLRATVKQLSCIWYTSIANDSHAGLQMFWDQHNQHCYHCDVLIQCWQSRESLCMHPGQQIFELSVSGVMTPLSVV